MKYKRNNWKLHHALVVLGISLLSACATANYNATPPIPKGGECTAQELSQLNPVDFPCTHDFLDRLGKAHDQAEVQ